MLHVVKIAYPGDHSIGSPCQNRTDCVFLENPYFSVYQLHTSHNSLILNRNTMKRLFTVLALCLPLVVLAQPSTQQEAKNFISFNQQKVLGLANAFSEAQYDWRPAEGVRSVAEVLLHITSANYFFMSACGFELPDGVDPSELEKTVTGKDNIISSLTNAYNFLTEHITEIKDSELGDKVEFPFPGEYTKLSAIMLSVDHCSEHLGQLIAYARMNGITPPWSKKEEGN